MATVSKEESGKVDRMNSSSTTSVNVINNHFSRTNLAGDSDEALSPSER